MVTMRSDRYNLSANNLALIFSTQAGFLRLDQLGLSDPAWLHAAVPSGLFAVTINGRRYRGSEIHFESMERVPASEGVDHTIFYFSGPGFSVTEHIKTYAGATLIEMQPVIQCTGGEPCRITRVDSFSLAILPASYSLFHFTGDWGQEFEPIHTKLTADVILESRSGRSSKGDHPWFALTTPTGDVLTGSVAWSGNWAFRFPMLKEGGYEINGGLNDWCFEKDLLPGQSMEAPAIILAFGTRLDVAVQQFIRAGRTHMYPRNELSSSLPVEWNTWWPYQDYAIDEATFKNNVEEAERLGIEICTLDAGWFGTGEAGSTWHDLRGDWQLVNARRFPNGIRHLSDFTHAHGMKFGLWCEIEGLGSKAQLAIECPAFVAVRGTQPLGYVCFGNPEVQEWAYQTLSRLIRDYHCDWIKLDFNVDPLAGCNRCDHGHGAGDGLFEHVQGYYQMLDRVRSDFPELVLENCSSGGLRIDLGILRHTHLTFLSDPDWPEHDLQIFWGATQMIAPGVCLHWSFCEWPASSFPPQQTFNPRDPDLTPRQLDYYTRISMLGIFGFSQKLPDLPGWVSERLAAHIKVYKSQVRRFISQSDLFHLTGQPRRSGSGDHWAAFQYALPDRSEHLVAIFRLKGSEAERNFSLQALDPTRQYRIEALDGNYQLVLSGDALMKSGLPIHHLVEEDSILLRVY